MTKIFMTHYRQYLNDTLVPDDSNGTRYQETCKEVCRVSARVLTELPQVLGVVTGIVFGTRLGERFPELWKETTDRGARLRPRQFGQAVLNSGAGFASIAWNLQGPQVVVVDGDPEEIAELLIKGGLATHIVVCKDEVDRMEAWVED